VGSLTNQNVTGYSFRLISDNPGKFWDLTTAAPGSGQTNYSAAATYYDANGNPLTTTGTYMISAGGITISASGANNSSGANRWYLEPVADDYNSGVAGGFYRIKNVWNGNYLDASGSTVAARRAVGGLTVAAVAAAGLAGVLLTFGFTLSALGVQAAVAVAAAAAALALGLRAVNHGLRRRLQIPDQAQLRQAEDQIIGRVPLPPAKALAHAVLIGMVVVVPAFAHGDDRQPPIVPALVSGDIVLVAMHMRQRVDAEGAVIDQHGRDEEADEQAGPAIDGEAGEGERDRRRGIARQRLQYHGAAVDAGFEQLLGGEKAVILAGHHDGRGHVGQLARACHGLLEQRAVACQGEKLLGQIPARNRPQAGAAAAAENQGDQHGSAILSLSEAY